MLRLVILSFLIPAVSYAANKNHQMLNKIETLKTFALGSCNSQKRSQPLWKYINQEHPQLWIWGGDNIYGDTSNPNDLYDLYQYQNHVPEYKKLRQSTPIIGIWDDHDYGYDNATWNNPLKHISQQLFLDFISEPSKSKRRYKDGVYTSHTFGTKGKQVKFILLDNRFFHTSPEADDLLLGKKQWQWLEDELKYSQAQMHFILGGLSFLSPKIIKTEEWADHPKAKAKLLSLIKRYDPKGLIFLSGDKHFASVFKQHDLLEFMSSGMTHTVPRILRGYVGRFYPNAFFGLNYGKVEIHWNKRPLEVSLKVMTYRKKPIFNFRYQLQKNNRWKLLKQKSFQDQAIVVLD